MVTDVIKKKKRLWVCPSPSVHWHRWSGTVGVDFHNKGVRHNVYA